MKNLFTLISLSFVGIYLSNAQYPSVVETLSKEGFENVASVQIESELYITYENNLYRFEAKGLANIISLFKDFDFQGLRQLHLLLRSQDIPMSLVTIRVSDLRAYHDGTIDRFMLASKMVFSLNVDNTEDLFKNSVRKNSSFNKIDIPVGVHFDYALGDFNDGFMSRTYINTRLLSTFGRGTEFEFEYSNIVQNDLPGSAISSPVILKVTQNARLGENKFISASLGYLPQQRFGLHTRFRNYLNQERFYVEFFFSLTRLGYLDQNWSPESNRNSDAQWQAIINYRWNKFDTDINFTYGTFLAGDLGYKLQLTRQFNEVYFNLFYARTDVLSVGSFGKKEDGLIGFSVTVPFGQSKYMKPKRIRGRTEDRFDLLYRYSGFSLSGIDIAHGSNILSDIRQFYPEILRKGLIKHLKI